MASPKSNKKAARGQSSRIWNILTVVVLLLVVCFGCVFLNIFINPYSGLNIFPPEKPTKRAVVTKLVTMTFTPDGNLPPTWTSTPPLEPTVTDTPRPTATLPLTATPFSLEMLYSPTPSPTTTKPPMGYPYEIQKPSPLAMQNIYHSELECLWMGVGGTVLDLSGAPMIGMIVQLGGKLPGVELPTPMYSLTGAALNYGPSGYEFQLAGEPLASKKGLWLQLLDQALSPVSDKVYFDTYKDCTRNLILINFKQVRP